MLIVVLQIHSLYVALFTAYWVALIHGSSSF